MSASAVTVPLPVGPRAPRAGRLDEVARAGLRGIGWMGLSQVVGMAIKLGSNLVLTRLLAPGDYGLFATAMAVVTTLEWLSDLGIQPALVRHADGGRPEFLRTGWWMGLGRGLTLSVLAGALARPLAHAYGRPSLFPVLLVLAARPAILALRSPGMPALRRALDYRAIFVDETSQVVVATGVGLALAWSHPSPWVIVAGTLAGAATGVAASYGLCPIRPRWEWDPGAALAIADLGRQVFLNTLVMALGMNLDRLLGLRFVSESRMGLYAVAWNLAAVAEGLLARACDVHYSILSRRGDPESRAAWHLAACRRVASWGMPAMALGVAVSPAVVRLLYDPRYAGAGPLLAILGARLMARALGQVQFQYLLVRGEVRVATRAYLVALAAQVACLPPLARVAGVEGLALAGLLSTTILTLSQSLSLRRRGDRVLSPLLATLGWMAVGLAIASRLVD